MSFAIVLSSTSEPVYITGGVESPTNPIYLWDGESDICTPGDESAAFECPPPVNLDGQ